MRPEDAKYCPRCSAALAVARHHGRDRKHCGACGFVLYQNPATAAAGIVVDDRGRVLLVQRAIEPYQGAWALPAGYQELEESPAETAVREVREEGGLEVEIVELFDVVRVEDVRRPAAVAVYLCRVVAGEATPGPEESAARWFAPDELPDELAFGNGALLARLAASGRLDGWRERTAPPASTDSSGALSYKDAGVDIDAATEALARSREAIRSTFTPGVLGDIGLFGGLFDPARVEAEGELLVASADGVGSKLEVARRAGIFHTVGRDLVQHCVNDILVQGARPLFFMDYVGVGALDPVVVSELIRGCAEACRDEGIALLGGETAEMPGTYAPDDFDLVGFVVGSVRRERLLDGSRVRPGQVLLGLASSGLHTNGYSLARKIAFERLGLDVSDRPPGLEGRSVGEALLAPHRSYYRPLWPLLEEGRIAALAHITGGGLVDNLPRVLGDTDAVLDPASWTVPPIFRWLCEAGEVATDESRRAFNLGVGMVVFVDEEEALPVRDRLIASGEDAWLLGRVESGSGSVRFEPGVWT